MMQSEGVDGARLCQEARVIRCCSPSRDHRVHHCVQRPCRKRASCPCQQFVCARAGAEKPAFDVVGAYQDCKCLCRMSADKATLLSFRNMDPRCISPRPSSVILTRLCRLCSTPLC